MAPGVKGLVMTINELIRELQKYDGNQEIMVCNYVYDDNMEIIEFQYFEPSIDIWDETIPTNDPENLVSINPGGLISG